MAFDLRARLRLDDRMSDPLRRIARQAERNQRIISQLNRTTSQLDRANQRWIDSNGRLRDGLGRFARQTESNQRAMERLNRTTQLTRIETGRLGDGFRLLGGTARGIFSLKNAFVGLAAAIGGTAAARKVFDNTIGEAAKYEQSAVTIEAMFKNSKKASKYMSEMNKLAIDSPLLNSQDIFANSKSFIAFSQSIPTLKKMFRLAERFVALDPFQGVEGAVFSMKELFSGDAMSIQKRFEIGTKKEWNAIKKLPVKEQIGAIDKLLNKYRITDDLIKKMGGTTLGIWNQIKEKTQVILRDMGKPALKVIKKFLDEINNGMSGDKLSGFQKTGADILKNIATGFVESARSIGNWIQSIQNDSEFKKKTTLFGKVEWIISDIFDAFINWLDGGGSEKIAKTVDTLIQSLAAVIEASTKALLPVAIKVGSAIGSGIVQGVNKAIKDSWVLNMLADSKTRNEFLTNKASQFVGKKVIDYVIGNKKKSSGTGNGSSSAGKFGPKPKSYASGLTRVPYNGYQATLHKNERILTPEEAKEYNAGRGGGNTYHFGNIIIQGGATDRQTARKLLEAITREIELAGGAGA